MKEFLLVFRGDQEAMWQGSPEEMQATAKKWQDWMGGIAAQNKLVAAGKRMSPAGKVVRAKGLITDGPYIEVKESIVGQATIRAESLEEAVETAQGCPILLNGGNVEVRELNVS